jgi:hypothetical protein
MTRGAPGSCRGIAREELAARDGEHVELPVTVAVREQVTAGLQVGRKPAEGELAKLEGMAVGGANAEQPSVAGEVHEEEVLEQVAVDIRPPLRADGREVKAGGQPRPGPPTSHESGAGC